MTEKEFPYRAVLECGAFFKTKRVYGVADGFNLDPKTGRLRITVLCFDPGSKATRPRTEDGYEAECFACKCRRKSGRKEQQVFVTNEKGDIVDGKRPVPMITCLIKEQVEASND